MTASPQTASEALDAVAALFSASYPGGTPVASLSSAGVTRAYDHEPAIVQRGCSVTVSFAGMDPYDWFIAVRVYGADNDPKTSQRLTAAAVEAVDALLAEGGFAGPSEWESGFDSTAEVPVHLAMTTQRVGRSDTSMH